jgi:hypothetical protein
MGEAGVNIPVKELRRVADRVSGVGGGQFHCPNCGARNTSVLDSRPLHDGTCIRRRRGCLGCEHRFTTYETMDSPVGAARKIEQARQLALSMIVTGQNMLHALDGGEDEAE